MAICINKEQYNNALKLCQKGKHKLRENSFGVVWCVRCGLLSTSVGNSQPLAHDDQICIK